jgi:hypothetical protein
MNDNETHHLCWRKLCWAPKLFSVSWGSSAGRWIELIGGKQQLQSSWQGLGILSTWTPMVGAAASLTGPQHSTLLNSGTFEWK